MIDSWKSCARNISARAFVVMSHSRIAAARNGAWACAVRLSTPSLTSVLADSAMGLHLGRGGRLELLVVERLLAVLVGELLLHDELVRGDGVVLRGVDQRVRGRRRLNRLALEQLVPLVAVVVE